MNSMILRTVFSGCLAAAIAMSGSFARAQTGDDLSEAGFKFGNLALHTQLKLIAEYSSNIKKLSKDLPGVDPVGDIALHINPSVGLHYPIGIVEFELSAAADYMRFFGVDQDTTSDMSNLAADASIGFTVNRNGRFEFGLRDNYLRTYAPWVDAVNIVSLRNHNVAGADFTFRPGGKAISLLLGYEFVYDWYDDNAFQDNNFRAHVARFKAQWDFLPQTNVYLAAEFSALDYYDFLNGAIDPNALPFEVVAGFSGRITPKLDLKLNVGFAGTFPDSFDSKNTVIGQAELIARLMQGQSLAIGFQRKLSPLPDYQYTADNKAYLKFNQMLMNDFLGISLGVAYHYQQFGPFVSASLSLSDSTRSDHFIVGDAGLSFQFLKWLGAGIGYSVQYRSSDAELQDASNAVVGRYDYIDHRGTLEVIIGY